MTPHLNCLDRKVQMRGHNIWFQWEIRTIIPQLSSNTPLIYSSVKQPINNNKTSLIRAYTIFSAYTVKYLGSQHLSLIYREAIQPILERRGLDLTEFNVFVEASNTPLPLNCETFLLGGTTMFIRGECFLRLICLPCNIYWQLPLADENSWICKQLRSWWGGSLWATSSRSTVFAL